MFVQYLVSNSQAPIGQTELLAPPVRYQGHKSLKIVDPSLGKRGKLCHEAHKPMVVGPP